MFLKLFLVAISLVSLVSGRFACGRDEMTSKFNENMVEKGCPELIRGFDECCLRHGRCYDFKEKKREECDATFCQCLNNQAKKNKGCNFAAENLCNNAKAWGFLHYPIIGRK